MIRKTFRIDCAVLAALVVVVVPLAVSPGTAKSSGAGPDCSGWLTEVFWQAAVAEDVERCLAAGAKIEARGRYGDTPLHKVASRGQAATVNALIAAGAEIDARDGRGMTPLHKAASRGQAATVNALIAAGTEIDARDGRGMTPLHKAALSRHESVIIVLLDAGADGTARTPRGRNPFDLLRMGAAHPRWLERDAWQRLRDARSR